VAHLMATSSYVAVSPLGGHACYFVIPIAPSAARSNAHPAVLFDGVCKLCDAAVLFLIDRDPRAILRFASLQSDTARELLESVGGTVETDPPKSILLVENGRVYERSTAALRIARHLEGAWKLLGLLLVVPAPVRDLVYRWIASNRYRWFGRSPTCRVPTPQIRARFLDG
jgi:predicted DCC family thiol-disulfide oxidoreductase YuxK